MHKQQYAFGVCAMAQRSTCQHHFTHIELCVLPRHGRSGGFDLNVMIDA